MFKKIAVTAGIAVGSLLAGGCAETPQTGQSSVADTTASSSEPSDVRLASSSGQKNCQTDEATGSHLTKRTVCLTDEQERDQKQALDQMRNYRHTGQGGTGGN